MKLNSIRLVMSTHVAGFARSINGINGSIVKLNDARALSVIYSAHSGSNAADAGDKTLHFVGIHS